MKKIKYFFNFIYLYRRIFFQVILFEIFYSIKFHKIISNIKIQDNKFRTDIVPCIYFFLHKISNFINKHKIKSIVDVGSGFGRVVNFVSIKNNIVSYGIEYDKEVAEKSLKLKNKKVKLYCGDIFNFNLKKFQSNCFILVDPFKKIKDRNKFLNKVKKEVKKKPKYIITVNVSQYKFPKGLKLIYSIIGSEDRYLKIYKFK